MTSNQPACDEAGTRGKLMCVATRECWCNSKVIHCTKKYWGLKTATGKYEHARQFLVLTCRSIRPVSLLPLFYFCSSICSSRRSLNVFALLTCCFAASVRRRYPVSLFLPFTWHLCSPDSLFPLLALVFASQSHTSCAFFLALTSCLASFPSPRPAFSHL